MSTNSVPVIKFLFRSEWKPLTEALSIAPGFEAESFDTASDLSTFLSGAPAGLIVASLKDKNDLIQIATFLKHMKKVAGNSYFKVIVRNTSGDKQFEKAIAKLGILDLVDDKIQTKALRFKLDFMMKSINVHLKRIASANANNAANTVKSLDVAKAQEKKLADNQPVWTDGLDCEDDVWLLRTEADCKKVLNRWLIKFMGPSPYVAQWSESGTPGIWKMEFKSGSEDFIYGKGSWYYRGDQKPDFIWAENNWLFTGSSFDLFYKDGNVVQSRLKLADKVLTIAKNSDYAKTKEQKIIESFDKDLVFKKDMASKLDMETTDKEAELYKNLEGKGKTDELQGGPLSGKGKTDALKGGPLAGKGKTSDLSSDPLAMDLKPEDNKLGSDPLSQKAGDQQEKSKWKGKNSYEPQPDGPHEAPVDSHHKTGAQLSLDAKGSHEKFYRNHNETEKFDPKDMAGKSSTDEIEGHLSSPNAQKAKEKEKKDQEQASIGAQAGIGGKSSTDKLDGHLRSPEQSGGSKEADKAKAQKDAISAQDKNSKKTKEESERELQAEAQKANDIRGKSSTDKLPGHLSSPHGAVAKKAEPNNTELDEATEQERKALAKDSVQKSPSEKSNVLPFAEKAQSAKVEEDSPDLTASMQSAKVTTFLIQDLVKIACVLDDFYDQTIIFSSDQTGIVVEKKVSLNMNFNYMNKDTSLKFDGSVMQIDSDEEGSYFITVEISKENATAFNSFMKLYGTRQENINFFLKTVKGM